MIKEDDEIVLSRDRGEDFAASALQMILERLDNTPMNPSHDRSRSISLLLSLIQLISDLSKTIVPQLTMIEASMLFGTILGLSLKKSTLSDSVKRDMSLTVIETFLGSFLLAVESSDPGVMH